MNNLIISSWRKVEYIAQKGFKPPFAIPAQKVTACCSAIPTSKVLPGKLS